MSQLVPEVLAKQDELHSYLEGAFAGQRLERDANGESILWLKGSDLLGTLECIRSDERLQMDRLSDLTVYDNVDGVDGAERFVAVYQLYSMKRHLRLRLKVLVAEDQDVPSVTGIWSAANWLEREAFDMFGVRFSGHPDLRRLLMDERFVGHPLRKEYGLEDRQPFPDSLPVRIAERRSEGQHS